MKSQRHSAILLLFIVLMMVLGQALPAAAQDTGATAVTSGDAAPLLLSAEPQEGSSWDGQPVTWIFDEAVEIHSETVAPALDGVWSVEKSTVRFTAAGAPDADQRYRLGFEVLAAGAGEDAPTAVVELALRGQSPLRVTSTQPADGASDVAVDGAVVVAFNRPVVPLVGASEQATLPQPLTFDPPLAGRGEWLGTSIYAFTPDPAMAGATLYAVTVEPMTAVGGEVMADAFTFSFSTATPTVTNWFPIGKQINPDTFVRVDFSQPMDTASTEDAFGLYLGESNTAVEGTFAWDEAQMTLRFTPTLPLELGGIYTIRIDESAQPASLVGSLREPFSSPFTVTSPPAVLRTTPYDGEHNVLPDQVVSIEFASPMSRTLLLPEVSIAPPITASLVYSYYNEWENVLTLDWPRGPGMTYTVTVGADATDLFGNTLGEDQVTSFSTGDWSSFVRVDLDKYTHFTPITTTHISLFYRNMDEMEQSLFRLPIDEFVDRFNGPNAWNVWDEYEIPDREANLVWSRTYTTTETRNETYQAIVPLDDGEGNPLSPGLYLLETKRPPGISQMTNEEVDRILNVIAIANNGLVVKKSTAGNSLAWLTDVVTGQPVEGSDVEFRASGGSLGVATTDDQGVAVQSLDFPTEAQWLPMVAVASEPDDEGFAIATSEWNQGIATWDFSINGGYNMEEYQSVYYTERPIYRPGQTVYWKGIVRRLNDNSYELPNPAVPLTITVTDDRGNIIVQQLATFNEMGAVDGEFNLAPDAFTGYYYLNAQLPTGGDQYVSNGVSFQVASYRKPEFEVTLTPSQTDYNQGDKIEVDVQANYFSGGPLARAPLTWRVLAEPYTFVWENAPQGRWFSFEPVDPDADTYDPFAPLTYYGQVKEGSGETDAAGAFTVALDADLGEAQQSQRWTMDVTVQSSTNQFVNAVTTFPVHRAEYYLGLSPQNYVAEAGKESLVDVVAVAPDGQTVGGVDIDVTVYEYRWNNVRQQGADGRFVWQSSVERIPVSSESVRTGQDGMVTTAWIPPKGGQYQVIATSEDQAGNSIASATFVYAADSDPTAEVSWRRENNDRIALVADKDTYEPGDVARVLVPNPFLGPVTALVTYERAGVNHFETREMEGGSPTLEIPITEEYIPNIFANVVLVKGIDETNPSPAIRVGMVQLDVDTAARELSIEAMPDLGDESATAKPGQIVTWTVSVSDASGEPVANSEVSVAVVDKALLALAADAQSPLIESFYRVRPLSVATGATLIINRDRVSQQLSEGAKGGGGGDGFGLIEMREEFPDTAFWRANFTTDENGQFVFAMEMPDNLTAWRLFARAVTDDTHVGDGETDLVVTKDLQVRPILPRFFTGGDRARIGAVVFNTTDVAAADGSFFVDVEGATLEGDHEYPLELAAGESARFDFPISVPDTVDAITVTMAAEAGSLSDGVRLVLPVSRYRTPEVVGTSGVVEEQSVTEAILVPENAQEGSLEVRVEPSLAAGMTEGLTWLEHYPWECNEQTISRYLPNLFTAKALTALSVEDAGLKANLDYQVGAGTQKLISRQNADGGWGYWQGDASQPFVTAWVLWGLANTLGAGYPLPADALERAVDYLQRNYVAPADVEEAWKLNQLAFTHFVLSEMGEGDPGRMSTLYDVRERLQYYGKALLAMALYNVDAGDARVSTLLDDLASAARASATGTWWSEASVDWQTLNTDVRSTALALEAFTRIQPENPLLPGVVRWLMSARQAGTWSNTQETAWSIMALTDWMVATQELEANYDWSVTLNTDELGSGHFDESSLREPVVLREELAAMLRDAPNLLELARSDDPGRMYYSAWLNYTLDAMAIGPLDRGIVVDRRFEIDGEQVTSARVGDIISVTVTIVAPDDLHQLSVEVPIPAGTEIIDPNLISSPQYDAYGAPLARTPWSSWSPTFRDFRDDRVALFDNVTPAGTYQYTFPVRATLPGEFRVLPAHAEMMYFTEVWGRSGGEVFTVTE